LQVKAEEGSICTWQIQAQITLSTKQLLYVNTINITT